MCLVSTKSNVLGYFDVYPLKNDFLERFIEGVVTEKDITHEQILAPKHAKKLKRLYLAGLAVRNPHTHTSKRHASILVWGVIDYLIHMYGDTPRILYALGATPEGERLLKHLGFRIKTPARKRADKHTMYEIEIDKEKLNGVARSLPDWSQYCHETWKVKIGPHHPDTSGKANSGPA